jgi:transposase
VAAANNGDWTKVLGWPGYRVFQQEIDEANKTLKLWVRRKKTGLQLVCSGCGKHVREIHEVYEREVRDLPVFQYRTTIVVELHRVRCPRCGVKAERVAQLPSKAPFSKRFEEEIGQACESAAARQVARRFALAASTVRAIDLRYLERWAASRRKPPLRQLGIDEIYLGKTGKFITVASNLETGEPLWFGQDRKKETLDAFFGSQLSGLQRIRVQVACVDMWEPYKLSLEECVPKCAIVYDKFHVMQHANKAVDEVRRAEFFRQGGNKRQLVKGKRWILLTRWVNLSAEKQQVLNQLFRMNRKLMKAYLLKESLEGLWKQDNAEKAAEYLANWVSQLRWQRLPAFEKLAKMLLDHHVGLFNYYEHPVRFGVVEAINGNIRLLLRRGRGYQNLRYLLLKAQRMAATKTELVAFRIAA